MLRTCNWMNASGSKILKVLAVVGIHEMRMSAPLVSLEEAYRIVAVAESSRSRCSRVCCGWAEARATKSERLHVHNGWPYAVSIHKTN